MPNESHIGRRFKIYLDSKGLSGNEAGRLIGASGAQISNILKGENFSIKILTNIFNAFPDLNPSWLIEEQGQMLREKWSPKWSPEWSPNDKNEEKKEGNSKSGHIENQDKKKPPDWGSRISIDPELLKEPGLAYNIKTSCQTCHANERVIAALQAHINTLERELHRQQAINDELQGRDDGKKRKVG
jgi:transcriptional regulator with XRE-family HTH domain